MSASPDRAARRPPDERLVTLAGEIDWVSQHYHGSIADKVKSWRKALSDILRNPRGDSESHSPQAVGASPDRAARRPYPKVEFYEERAAWYRDGCGGLQDRDGYYLSGDCAKDAASDLLALCSRVRDLEAAVAAADAGGGEASQEESMTLERDLSAVLNTYSQENASNTPDFILAQYLLGCLAAWNQGVQQRETWYGRDARPTGGHGPVPVDSTGVAASLPERPE